MVQLGGRGLRKAGGAPPFSSGLWAIGHVHQLLHLSEGFPSLQLSSALVAWVGAGGGHTGIQCSSGSLGVPAHLDPMEVDMGPVLPSLPGLK